MLANKNKNMVNIYYNSYCMNNTKSFVLNIYEVNGKNNTIDYLKEVKEYFEKMKTEYSIELLNIDGEPSDKPKYSENITIEELSKTKDEPGIVESILSYVGINKSEDIAINKKNDTTFQRNKEIKIPEHYTGLVETEIKIK